MIAKRRVAAATNATKQAETKHGENELWLTCLLIFAEFDSIDYKNSSDEGRTALQKDRRGLGIEGYEKSEACRRNDCGGVGTMTDDKASATCKHAPDSSMLCGTCCRNKGFAALTSLIPIESWVYLRTTSNNSGAITSDNTGSSVQQSARRTSAKR